MVELHEWMCHVPSGAAQYPTPMWSPHGLGVHASANSASAGGADTGDPNWDAYFESLMPHAECRNRMQAVVPQLRIKSLAILRAKLSQSEGITDPISYLSGILRKESSVTTFNRSGPTTYGNPRSQPYSAAVPVAGPQARPVATGMQAVATLQRPVWVEEACRC